MTTRAAFRNSHIGRAGGSPRAALSSSHDHSSTSSESGRERRRKGKLKMKLQLDAAHLRISTLEERNRTLMEIIAKLTSDASGGMVSSPLVFDLFCRDGDFADAAVQTDISVDWSKPDIFVRLSQDMNTPAHADAAAGEGPPESHCLAISQKVHEPLADLTPTQCGPPFAATTTRLRNLTSVSQEDIACLPQSANKEDFHSRDLEVQCGPLPNNTSPECSDAIAHASCTSRDDHSSHDLAEQCGPLIVSQQVSDVQHSQDLAEPCGPLPTCTSPVSVDVEAFNLRDHGKQCGTLPNHTAPELFDTIAHTCHTSKVDISTQDLAEQCGPLPIATSHVLDNGNSPFCNAFKEDYNSQDLAEQCGPQPSSLRFKPQNLTRTFGKSSGRSLDTVISPKTTTAPHPVESAPETRRTALSSRDEGAHTVESAPGILELSSRDEPVLSSSVSETSGVFGPSLRELHSTSAESVSQALAIERHGRVQEALAFVKCNAPRITEGLLAHTERFAASEFYGNALQSGKEIAHIALQTSIDCYLQDAG